MVERAALESKLALKRAALAVADQRFRALAAQAVNAVEDPPALDAVNEALAAARHEINELDVEIARLEQSIADLGG